VPRGSILFAKLTKEFLLYRSAIDRRLLPKQGIDAPGRLFSDFEERVAAGENTTQLLSAEAIFAKGLYSIMAQTWKIQFTRDAGKRESQSPEQKVNSFLDHGNYIAYGYAATCLHGLGIPFFLPVLHGKTRRGALVFDVADLFKDYLVMPLAFEAGAKGLEERVFRAKLIERSIKLDILDEVMTFVQDIAGKVMQKHEVADLAH
jgi:CRISPR-associated protein Cas1